MPSQSCIPMATVELVTKSKTWKQPTCPSSDEENVHPAGNTIQNCKSAICEEHHIRWNVRLRKTNTT